MKITKVESIPLRLPVVTEACDGTQDNLVIRIHTDEGIVGIGEVDSCPTVVDAIVRAPRSHAIATGLADLAPEVADRIQHVAKRVYQTLELSGYARIDLRLTADGRVYVLEANPNPQIARKEDFAEAAASAGVDYPALLQRILSIGMRWEPERLG